MLYVFILAVRYISRCLLIEFSDPPLDISVIDYVRLPLSLKKSSSAIGALISLGKKFVDSGISEIGKFLQVEVRKVLEGMAIPRVILSYATLLWFTIEVCLLADLCQQKGVECRVQDVCMYT